MPVPAIVASVVAASAVLVPLARRLLLGVGFGIVAYAGIGALWTSVQTEIAANLSATSGSILTILGMARVDDAIQVILSAGTARLTLRGLTAAGSIFAPRWKWTA